MTTEFRCDCHPKHQRILSDHDKQLDENHEDHEKIANALKERVTNKFFLVLVLLIISNLGFQIMIYDKLQAVDKATAIIETRLTSHIRATTGATTGTDYGK